MSKWIRLAAALIPLAASFFLGFRMADKSGQHRLAEYRLEVAERDRLAAQAAVQAAELRQAERMALSRRLALADRRAAALERALTERPLELRYETPQPADCAVDPRLDTSELHRRSLARAAARQAALRRDSGAAPASGQSRARTVQYAGLGPVEPR